jgi:hypothetical protein
VSDFLNQGRFFVLVAFAVLLIREIVSVFTLPTRSFSVRACVSFPRTARVGLQISMHLC